jgi:broad specificity phosphatase PhoE
VSRLVLVRHGHAAAAWDADRDPGLDAAGHGQAAAVAAALSPDGPLPVVVSPLRRTRETAAALERVWGVAAAVEPAVGEIRAPVDDLAGRGEWLRGIYAGRWAEQDEALVGWRDRLLAALGALDRATVVVTHFFGINAAVGAASGDDRLVSFRPDHCSRTVLENDGGRLRLVALGAEGSTRPIA